jgi:hypothetical protein
VVDPLGLGLWVGSGGSLGSTIGPWALGDALGFLCCLPGRTGTAGATGPCRGGTTLLLEGERVLGWVVATVGWGVPFEAF